jgi:hypothetical protein
MTSAQRLQAPVSFDEFVKILRVSHFAVTVRITQIIGFYRFFEGTPF